MAELFSLMLESTPCKSDPVEPTRTLFRCTSPASVRRAAPDLLRWDACATGGISRDARSAKLCARHETVSQFTLKMTPGYRLSSFAKPAFSSRQERGRRDDGPTAIRPFCSRTGVLPFITDRTAELSTVSQWRRRPRSVIGGSRHWRPQTVEKSPPQKSVENRPIRQNRQHFQGVYFLSP